VDASWSWHTVTWQFNTERLLWTLPGEDLLDLFRLFFKGWPRKTTRAALITHLLRAQPDRVMEAALQHTSFRARAMTCSMAPRKQKMETVWLDTVSITV